VFLFIYSGVGPVINFYCVMKSNIIVSKDVYIASRVDSIFVGGLVNKLIGKLIKSSPSNVLAGKLVMISIVQTGGITSLFLLLLISGVLLRVNALMNWGVIR